MKFRFVLPSVSFGLLVLALGCKGGASDPAASKAVPYASVQAVLTEKCAGCHGANNPKAGVGLASYEAVMKGGEDGPIVKAGDPTGSELIQVMRGVEGHKKMPPAGPPAPEEQIKLIEDWIKDGAKPG